MPASTPDGDAGPGDGGLDDRTVAPAEPPPAKWYTEEMAEAVKAAIHNAEMNEWPKISADPKGGCLGGDRCTFVTKAALDAIAPSVEALRFKARTDGHDAGWKDAREAYFPEEEGF